MQIHQALSQYFGYSSFREPQEAIIQAILHKKDTLAILPTGGGKSLCYQLPAILLPGLTIVISPLISLMKDQVDSLRAQQIPAAYLNSSLDSHNYQEILTAVHQKQVKLLYVAPERLLQPGFIALMNQVQPQLVAVDEAHCVSQWGHDFRPSYRQIRDFVQTLDHRPILSAFTATASELVRQDICQQLDLNNPQVFISSFDRPNIQLSIQEPADKFTALKDLLPSKEPCIIYCSSRKGVDQLGIALQKAGYQAACYHAGLSHQERQKAQDDFLFDRIQIMVATNAFGMGIDKSDVRLVVHYNMPKDIENYYQEIGRAGRDGLASQAVLFFASRDILTAKYFIEESQDQYAKDRLEAMIRYARHSGCLRQYLLSYFGQTVPDHCGNCSYCLGEFKVRNMTREGQMILSCVIRMKAPYGMTLLAEVLKGSQNQKIRKHHFDQLSTYGLLKDLSLTTIKHLISQVIASNYLLVNRHHGLEISPKALRLLQGKDRLAIRENLMVASNRLRYNHTSSQDAVLYPDLYQLLKDLRLKLAQEENLPAYIIFNNASLVDMTNQLPLNVQEFQRINGVGPVKADKYGQAFLDIIQTYYQDKGLSLEQRQANLLKNQAPITHYYQNEQDSVNTDAVSIQEIVLNPMILEDYPDRMPSYFLCGQLLGQGLSIQEIAHKRHLRPEQVLQQLERCKQAGYLQELHLKLSPEVQQTLKNGDRSQLDPLDLRLIQLSQRQKDRF